MFDLSMSWRRHDHALMICADVRDVRRLARRRVPRMVFDFVDGAAGSESSMKRSRETFAKVELEPRALCDVRHVDLSIELLGRQSALPFFFAPTGATRLMHEAGETAVATVAAGAGIPYCLSTLGTTSVEDLAKASPATRRWFQLYLMSDRLLAQDMMARAWTCGFDVLVLTIDTPVPGRRNRDVRNGLVAPPRLTWRSIADIAPYPHWWIDKLTTKPVDFAMVAAESELPASRMAKVFDPAVTIADVEWVRNQWPGKVVVKGIQSVADARTIAGLGVDAIHLSNHGGRQLEHAPVPFELLRPVRDAVDRRTQIFVDGGVMSGVDMVACLAGGANAVAIGRAYLYGLMAAGEAGVRRVVTLLQDEIRSTLSLLGCDSVRSASEIAVRLRAG